MNGSLPPSSSTLFLMRFAALDGDARAGGLAAGERRGLHALVVEQRGDLLGRR